MATATTKQATTPAATAPAPQPKQAGGYRATTRNRAYCAGWHFAQTGVAGQGGQTAGPAVGALMAQLGLASNASEDKFFAGYAWHALNGYLTALAQAKAAGQTGQKPSIK